MSTIRYYLPTEITTLPVSALGEKLRLGSRALIVTGRSSAKRSGALEDVKKALEALEISWAVFDEVTENPMLETCHRGGRVAVEMGADYIIAIGGGSALDAGKAIAGFAGLHRASGAESFALPEMAIFEDGDVPCLPIVAIPTTAGTGSEANPYAVLTLTEGSSLDVAAAAKTSEEIAAGLPKKRTFRSVTSYPTLAVLDPKYTGSLPAQVAVSTALDAFAHCVESVFSPKCSELSYKMALYGAGTILRIMTETGDTLQELSDGQRRELLYAACAGGVAINQTGTGFPHPMGYNLTFAYGLPHGKACGVFMGAYLKAMLGTKEGRERFSAFASALAAVPAACGTGAVGDPSCDADGRFCPAGIDPRTSEPVELELMSGEMALEGAVPMLSEEELTVMASILAERIEAMACTDREGKRLPPFALSEEMIEAFIRKTGAAGNFANAVSPITVEEQREIYRTL